MDSLIKVITSLAPFLSAYPLWVKGLFSFWVVLTAVLFLVLVLLRAPDEQSARDRTGSLQTPVSTTQSETTVDSRIRDLLGKERKDITAYLGEPDNATTFKATPADIDRGESFYSSYLSYKRHGVTFLLWGAKVKTLFFYRQGVEGHLAYRKDVVEGLSPGMTRAQIESRFGRPTSSRGGGVGEFSVTYGALTPDCTVTINFDTTDSADMNARANVILIQKVGQ